jgi:hypothetical protein
MTATKGTLLKRGNVSQSAQCAFKRERRTGDSSTERRVVFSAIENQLGCDRAATCTSAPYSYLLTVNNGQTGKYLTQLHEPCLGHRQTHECADVPSR